MAADDSRQTRTVRIATYNIHRGRGLDGRTRIERIAAVLASIDADIIALQEVVGASPLRPGQAAELGAALGMGWVMAPTRHLRTALFGNVVLSRFPVRHHLAARPDVEDLRTAQRPARGRRLRRVHAAPLQRAHGHVAHRAALPGGARWPRSCTTSGCPSPKIILGDFNEWARGLATDILGERLQSVDLRKHLSRRPHLSRVLPHPAPRPHLLRRARSRCSRCPCRRTAWR